MGVVAHVPRHKHDYAYSRESKPKKDSNNAGSITLLTAEAIEVRIFYYVYYCCTRSCTVLFVKYCCRQLPPLLNENQYNHPLPHSPTHTHLHPQALGDESLQSHASLESMIADDTNFPFSSREVSSLELRHAQRRSLVPRDIVCFDLFLKKRNRQHKAANVRLVRMAPEFESVEGVWSGVVALECREDGAARSPSRREWGNKSARGEISLDKMQVGLEAAGTDIKSILSVHKIFFSPDVPFANETATASTSEGSKTDAPADPEPEAAPPAPPSTGTTDTITPVASTFLRFNSAVRVSLKRRILDQSLWVERVHVYTEASRVEGVVVQVRESYGFIKCKQQKHNVYFSYSELLPTPPADGKASTDTKSADQLRMGDKVTFFLNSGGEGGRKRDASPRRQRSGRSEDDVFAIEVMRVPVSQRVSPV